MRIWPALLLPLLISGCLLPDGPPTTTPETTPSADPARWTTRNDMPIPRTEVTCAALGQSVYVLGGFDSTNTATAFFHRYDAAPDAWTQLASFPIPIHHTGLVAYEGSLFTFGGYTGSFPFAGTNTVLRYDVSDDAWEIVTTLPRPRGAHATVLLGDHVHLIAGAPRQPGPETYADVDVFDLKNGTVRTGLALSSTREHLAGAAAADTIVAIGGRRMSLDNFDITETLSLDATSWATAEPMPTRRGGIAAAAWDRSVFVFGGEASDGTFDETESFDVTTGRWTTWPDTPHPRHGLCAAALNDGIHVIGGGPQPGLSVSGHHEVLSFAE